MNKLYIIRCVQTEETFFSNHHNLPKAIQGLKAHYPNRTFTANEAVMSIDGVYTNGKYIGTY